MTRTFAAEDDFDGVQYDDFYGPSAAHLEAEQIRRECAGRKPCKLCAMPTPAADLNRYGECRECTDAAEGAWGF
jgi:hypothetical protein